jgi:hypothetical protein
VFEFDSSTIQRFRPYYPIAKHFSSKISPKGAIDRQSSARPRARTTVPNPSLRPDSPVGAADEKANREPQSFRRIKIAARCGQIRQAPPFAPLSRIVSRNLA